jgi:hypothetical protein
MTSIKLSFIFLTVVLISCITPKNAIIQTPVYYKTVNVKTDKNISILSIDSSTLVKKNTYSFQVSKEPFIVKVKIDSSFKTLSLLTKNILPKRIYLVDTNHNFSVYRIPPGRTFIMYTDSALKIFRFPATTKKGTIHLTLSFPWINFFHTKTFNGYRNFSGFYGVEGGIEYFYKDNHYFSLNYGSATDFPLPMGGAVDYSGEHQTTTTSYLSLRKNYSINKFDFGYGLNISKHSWQLENDTDSTFVTIHSNSIGLGCSFAVQYRFTKFFRFGLLYQPIFIDLTNNSKFNYQHFISIEFIAKFPIYLYKRKRSAVGKATLENN